MPFIDRTDLERACAVAAQRPPPAADELDADVAPDDDADEDDAPDSDADENGDEIA